MTDLSAALRDVIAGFRSTRPKSLFRFLQLEVEDAGLAAARADVIAALLHPDPNAIARRELSLALAGWDFVASGAEQWAESTVPQTVERRREVYRILGFTEDEFEQLTSVFPIAGLIATEIYDSQWDPWYTAERRAAHNFYWKAYRGVLERKNWDAEAIATVDEMTTRIVSRLADPTAVHPYQSKGLVAGYVQSGKTANFTGLVAKSIDVGYRLVIVLTGTIELLRTQTQRRIDMELVGEENILGGVDRENLELTRNIDYIGSDDSDWFDGKFVAHGVNINATAGVPSIVRLTSFKSDFRRLKLGLAALDFRRTGELKDPARPVFDPVNIHDVDARLAIIKKNAAALKAIIHDLQSIQADAREIPVLIIDDEADLASINTKKPSVAEVRERTAINKLISELLTLLPRAQYLAYTATPYANVFAAPEDAEDIFPKDFIISLEPPASYMGARDFHDLDELADGVTPTPTNRNELAFVRDLRGTTDDEMRADIQGAIDMFVLTGAIKLWRQANDSSLRFPHHTMLVHSSIRQQDHSDLHELITDVWKASGFLEARGLARLDALYQRDVVPTTAARDWGAFASLPSDFRELRTFIGQAVSKILDSGSPAVIVNGSRESDYDAADFTRGDYWRILVGGAKLSRGFTVEGLTVSYFARRTQTQASMMQMGRWFGYRPGYVDLVRLFIAREVVDSRGVVFDLYDDFTSIVQDEEDFREQLRIYSEITEDGRPVMTPRTLPPLVYQRRPWLRPAARNQMYNARIVEAGIGGRVETHSFPHQLGTEFDAIHRQNFLAVAPWLSFPERELPTDAGRSYRARVGIVDAEEVYEALVQVRMQQDLAPTVGFIRAAINEGTLRDFVVAIPVTDTAVEVGGYSVPILTRKRRTNRNDFAPPGMSQRRIIEDFVADVRQADARPRLQHPGVVGRDGAPGLWDQEGRRGSLLIQFTHEEVDGAVRPIRDGRDILVTFANGMPFRSAPRGRFAYQAVDPDRPNQLVVDTTD